MRNPICAIAILLALGMSARAATPPPRLAGIVVNGGERYAIFAHDGDDTWTVAPEGGDDGKFQVRSITSDQVVVVGPDGPLALRTEERADRPAPAPNAPSATSAAETGAKDLGARSGLAAARYDDCVRRGLLPSSGEASALSRVEAAVNAMANAPPLVAPPGASPPLPPGAIAEWVRGGVASAQRIATDVNGAAGCQAAAQAWRDAKGRIGAL